MATGLLPRITFNSSKLDMVLSSMTGKKNTEAGDAAAAAHALKTAAAAAAHSSTQPTQGLLGSPPRGPTPSVSGFGGHSPTQGGRKGGDAPEGRRSPPKEQRLAEGNGKKTKGGPPPSAASRAVMKSFIASAATQTKRPATDEEDTDKQVSKRNNVRENETAQDRQNEEENMEEVEVESGEEEDEAWREQLREDLANKTGIVFSQTQMAAVMEVVVAAIKVRLAREAEKAAKKMVVEERIQVRENKADRKSSRSVLIHRADLWVRNDYDTEGYGLAERTTAAVFRVTMGMVQVRDAYVLGRWNANNPPTTVVVEFGSTAQKATFYRTVARVTQSNSEWGKNMRAISCRDAFPKKYVGDAQRLIQEGKALRDSDKVTAFRVSAQGPGCLPVLQVRLRGSRGQKNYKWTAWLQKEKQQGHLPASDLKAVSQPGGGGQEGGQGSAGEENQRRAHERAQQLQEREEHRERVQRERQLKLQQLQQQGQQLRKESETSNSGWMTQGHGGRIRPGYQASEPEVFHDTESGTQSNMDEKSEEERRFEQDMEDGRYDVEQNEY